jgi:hypothetical protein
LIGDCDLESALSYGIRDKDFLLGPVLVAVDHRISGRHVCGQADLIQTDATKAYLPTISAASVSR